MLRFTVSVIFPPLRGLSAEQRATVQAAKRRTAAELRIALNALRRDVRAEAPRRTAQLARSARVRRRRASEPGAVTYELVLTKFYGRFTNAAGRNRGWWEDEVTLSERAYRDIAGQAARAIAPAYLAAFRDRALRELGAAFTRAARQITLSSLTGRGPSLRLIGTFRL